MAIAALSLWGGASLGLGACQLGVRDPRLAFPPGGAGGGVAFPNAAPHTPYMIGDLHLCLDRPGTITITSVDSFRPLNDLHVDSFAITRQSFSDENRNKTIAEMGLAPTDGIVILDRPCDAKELHPDAPSPEHHEPQAQLLLQYSKPTEQLASNQGIVIHYTSRGNSYSETIAWTMTLCPTRDQAPAVDGCGR